MYMSKSMAVSLHILSNYLFLLIQSQKITSQLLPLTPLALIEKVTVLLCEVFAVQSVHHLWAINAELLRTLAFLHSCTICNLFSYSY